MLDRVDVALTRPPSMPGTDRGPGYMQIAQQLAARIRGGSLREGEQLPSERAMAEQLGVSRVTARKAVEVLRHQGLVTRRQGAGTFVARPTLAFSASRWTRFNEQMRLQGVEPGVRLVEHEIVAARSDIAETLDIPIGGPVLRVVRVHLGNGVPMGIDACYHPMVHFPGLEALDLSREHDELLAEVYGWRTAEARRLLEPKLATAADAERLEVSAGTPVMSIRWVGWDRRGRVWGCGDEVYHGSAAGFLVIAGAEDQS